MKLKNLNLFNLGEITIFTHFNYNVFAIKCDKKSFEKLNDINIDISDITIYPTGDVYICSSPKTSETNTANAKKILDRAFNYGLTVLDVYANVVKNKEDIK